ncbi:hypothetical protein [Nocardioides sp. SYSU DS0663]|uniref:hypothetical protein n=1 Tax=Nocardioides sp. SYSU DS0663 TaxID=3416445 RepID=UPI003F4B5125
MTDRRPKPCHHDRHLGQRVTRDHRDDCPTHTGGPCPGADGCAPCTAHHCVLCSYRHLDNDHPLTCTDCIAVVREDLEEIRWLSRHLRFQAVRGGRDGRLIAAAPIPGGDAMVLMTRAGADRDDLTWSPHLDDDHRADDVVPVLLPLTAWNQTIRAHYGHALPAPPTVTGTTHYLADRLTDLAQDTTGGIDWQRFTTDMAAVRRQLERVLHDEQDPEQGVACFECGDRRLVRKFARPRPCRHTTPERAWVREGDRLVDLGYPELAPNALERRLAQQPCGRCDQGGIADPSVGQSWECLGCRKQYDPGEYANAVRRHLLTAGPSGDGWTHIAMAAEAATTMTQVVVAPSTVRRWMDRNQVLSVCRWVSSVDGAREVPAAPGPARGGRPGHDQLVKAFAGRVHGSPGLRLVFWPSVSEQAARMVERAERAAAERAREDQQRRALRAAVDGGEDVQAAGRQLGIHPARVARFVDEWDATRQESA